MSNAKLTPLQEKVLQALAKLEMPWRLTGGGALIAAYTHHRATRDLDLFFTKPQLTEIPNAVRETLDKKGFVVSVLQSSPAFVRLKVDLADDSVLVDLVADNISPIEEPGFWQIEGTQIRVDTSHEILVNKLCALLGRCELRDLIDVEALLDFGGNLERALADAPRKDAGFSPLTLAWVLRGMPIEKLCKTLGLQVRVGEQLLAFRDRLVERLIAIAAE